MSAATFDFKPKLDYHSVILIPFYHGRISSDVAEKRLKSHGKNGGYLFRESYLKAGIFILSSITKGSVSHTMIPQSHKWTQSYHEAVVKMKDLVNVMSEVYCCPVMYDPSIDLNFLNKTTNTVGETSFKEVYVKNESSIFCFCCNFTAVSRRDLDNHIKIHKVKKCLGCMNYIGSNSFSNHTKFVCNLKTPNKVTCDVCNYKTFNKYSLNRHIKTHNMKPFTCQTCQSPFKTEKKMRNHSCLSDGKFKCEYCEKIISCQSNLLKHIKRKHNEDIKENRSKGRPRGRTYYNCDQCHFKTTHRLRLAGHKNHKHTERKVINHKCEFCSYETPLLSRMKGHRITCKKGATRPIIVSIIGEETIVTG